MPKIFLIYLLMSVFPAVSHLIVRDKGTNGLDTTSYREQTVNSSEKLLNNTNFLQLPQEGQASFYARRFHGRPTASGEPYDSAALTAAHKTLPFGTRVKVTNLRNDKSVVVKINDRGPHHRNRIIDVSKAAARKLGFVNRGVTRVRVEEASE